MNWIRIATGILDDPSIGALADDIGCDEVTTVGHVVGVLSQLPEHARDGNLSTVADRTIEAWARWTKKRGKFAAAFRARLCADTGEIRAWEKHNGGAMREADRKRERAHQWRLARKSGGDETDTESVPNPDRIRYVSAQKSVDVTGRDETASSAYSPDGEQAAAAAPAARAAAAALSPLVEVVLDSLGECHGYRSVAQALGEARNPEALAEELLAWHHGIGEQDPTQPPRPGVEWAVICQAVHDMRVAGARMGPKTLASFVQRLLDDQAKAELQRTSPGLAPEAKSAPLDNEADFHRFAAIKRARQGSAEWQAECEANGWVWQEAAS